MSLREMKKVRTREALAESGLRLFLAEGFEGTTMDLVAEAAAVSRSTAFRYFPSKEALFFHRQQQRLDQFGELLQQRAPAAGPTSFRAVAAALLEVAASYAAEKDTVLAQDRVIRSSRTLMAFDLQMDAAWENAIFRALARGLPTDSAERRRARIQAGALTGAVRAVMRRWLDGACEPDLLALGAEALGWLEQGLGDNNDNGGPS